MTRNILILLLSSAALACAGGPEVLGGGEGLVTPLPEQGKADNYISTNAREFALSGTAHAVLPGGYAELDQTSQEASLTQAVESRMSRVSSALKSHITEVLKQANGGSAGEKDPWFIYMKRSAHKDASGNLQVTADGARVRFDFEMELVGSVYLMSKLAPGEAAHRTFEVVVSEWSGDNTETVTVEIEGSESRDAFPRYDELFADGVFDIAIHFGGDYNAGRHDLETAKWVVETLVKDGWENPSVKTFEDLKIDSPPFTRTARVEGGDVEVQVYIYHSDMVTAENEAQLTEAMKTSLAARDAIFYSGHAGEGAGFILDYQPKHEIKAADFATLPLADKYQIYVFDGCRTYRSYVDDILKNPAKTWDNLDVITTVNTTPFSAGYYVIWEFLNWFTITTDEGAHFPLTWKTILRGVNKPSFKDVHYGVHGIDNDPKLNPHASEGIACQPCADDGACGAGGNLCLGYPGGSACGVACATDTACPDGYRCARLFDDPDLFYLPKQCVKRDYNCDR